MPLTVEGARLIEREWRPKFKDEAAFESSWSRYFADVKVPDASRLEAWLVADWQIDQLKHAGIVKEPLLPVRQDVQFSDCWHCGGMKFVRLDVGIDHPKFGKVFACPDCNGGRRGDLVV
jgi:hypothetical protein